MSALHWITTACLSLGIVAGAGACGPQGRDRNGAGDDDDDDGTSAGQSGPESSLAACSDGVDNDNDGLTDCSDPECSGIGTCPICGMITHPLGSPLALPDGMGAGPAYTSKLNFNAFAQGATIQSGQDIQSVCVTMEHTWIRDLQIELHAPSGQTLVLQKMLGRDGDEIFLGNANDCDDAEHPQPGMGAEYCWTPAASNPPMLTYANDGMQMTKLTSLHFNDFSGQCESGKIDELPPGDYQAYGAWNGLVGASLNGDWEIFVQDEWEEDNGFIFQWSIAFDPALVTDCSGPVIE